MVAKWELNKEGCELGNIRINHLIFADDLLLISPSPPRILRMMEEAQTQLARAGLEVMRKKTAYLTTHPESAKNLPGTNSNESGMKILGRTFKIGDNTNQDMDIKIATAWSKFNKIRHILQPHTPLPHRLRIFKSCVGTPLG